MSCQDRFCRAMEENRCLQIILFFAVYFATSQSSFLESLLFFWYPPIVLIIAFAIFSICGIIDDINGMR